MKRIVSLAVLVLSLAILSSCSEAKKPVYQLQELDLLPQGVPLKIKAPKGSDVKKETLAGIMDDIEVSKADEKFCIGIKGQPMLPDMTPTAMKAAELSRIKTVQGFTKIIREEGDGFVYEINYGSGPVLDFYYVVTRGENVYEFKVGDLGTYSPEQVDAMYDAAKQK